MTHPSEFTRDGYRPLTPEEGDALTVGDTVRILNTSDGTFSFGSVIGCRRDLVKVRFMMSGHILPFDLDDPDLWGENVYRDRKPPQAEEDGLVFVLMTSTVRRDDHGLNLSAEYMRRNPPPPPVTGMAWPDELTRQKAPPTMRGEPFQPTQDSAYNAAHWTPTAECLPDHPPPASDLLNTLKASVKLAELEERIARLESLNSPKATP